MMMRDHDSYNFLRNLLFNTFSLICAIIASLLFHRDMRKRVVVVVVVSNLFFLNSHKVSFPSFFANQITALSSPSSRSGKLKGFFDDIQNLILGKQQVSYLESYSQLIFIYIHISIPSASSSTSTIKNSPGFWFNLFFTRWIKDAATG